MHDFFTVLILSWRLLVCQIFPVRLCIAIMPSMKGRLCITVSHTDYLSLITYSSNVTQMGTHRCHFCQLCRELQGFPLHLDGSLQCNLVSKTLAVMKGSCSRALPYLNAHGLFRMSYHTQGHGLARKSKSSMLSILHWQLHETETLLSSSDLWQYGVKQDVSTNKATFQQST